MLKEKRLKIGIIGIKGLPATKGADSVVESFTPHLIKKGHKIWVYGDEWGTNIESYDFEPVRIKSLSEKHLRPTSLFLFSSLHAVKYGNFDVVHLHNTEAAFTIPILKRRFPVVATSHGMAYRRDKWSSLSKSIIRKMDIPFCKWADVATCVSKPLSDYYKTQYGTNVRFIPNGIDMANSVDQTNAKKLLASLELSPRKYIIFVAGRILPTKGCHLLLQAVKKLSNPIKILVIGDLTHIPDYANKLQTIIPKQTIFTPLIKDKTTLFGLLSLSRLFVFPSTYEAMSIMLLEAIALGIPLISSDIPENSQIISEKDLLFKNRDIQSLARKIEWALKHTEKVKKIVKKVRKEVITTYNWEKIASQYLECYYEAIEKRKKL